MKLTRTVTHDSVAIRKLRNQGWRILIIWECGFRKPRTNRSNALDSISARAAKFLNSTQEFLEIPSSYNNFKPSNAQVT